MKKKIIILSAILIILIGVIFALFLLLKPTYNKPAVLKVGNSNGNIVNGGIASESGNSIYYAAKDGIYKTDNIGSTKVKIVDDKASFLNVVDDYLYYSLYYSLNGLYKVKNDRTGKFKICDDKCSYVIVADDWIYYINNSDDNKIYKIKTDGTSKTKLNNMKSSCLNLNEDWLYFFGNNEADSSQNIYKIKIDGSKTITVHNYSSDYAPHNLIVDNSGIYMSKQIEPSGDMSALYREIIKVKFWLNNQIITSVASESFNIKGHNLFISGNGLRKLSLNGRNETDLPQGNPTFNANIVGDWIYYNGYIDNDTQPHLFRLKSDGSQQTILD